LSAGLPTTLCGLVIPPVHGADYSPDFNSIFPELAARYNVALRPSVARKIRGQW
jgi:hypothetical protein